MHVHQLNLTFAALADPTRRAILARLAAGGGAGGEEGTSVTELAKPFNMTLPGISKHLKVLEKAHLITRSRDAQFRPCRLEAKPLKDAAEWIEHYRQFWEENFDRLAIYLQEIQAREPKTKERKHARRKK